MAKTKRPTSNKSAGPPLGVTSESAADTMRLGEILGRIVSDGTVIGLTGALGAGKTCFVKGLAKGMGVADPESVRSPTFTLLNSYLSDSRRLNHIDAYRLRDDNAIPEDLIEATEDKNAVTVIEWASEHPWAWPESRLEIQIEHAGHDRRKLSLRAYGDDSLATTLKEVSHAIDDKA